MTDEGQPNRSGRQFILLAIVLLLAGLTGTLVWLLRTGPAATGSEYSSAVGGPFRLIDQNGDVVTDRTLRGKPFAIFFGFTRCAEICPTTLQSMAVLRGRLGGEGERLNLVFVSLDPEHDTPADIGRYLGLFGTPIIGLTGNQPELDRITKAYHVYHEKVLVEGGDYVIDHTASVFLMDAEGRFSGTLSHGESEAPKLRKLERLMRT